MATIKKTYKPKEVNKKKLLTYLKKINDKKVKQ